MLRKNGVLFVKCKSTDDPLFGIGKKIAENMYEHGHVRHFFSEEHMKQCLQHFVILDVRKTAAHYDGKQSAFIEAVAKRM